MAREDSVREVWEKLESVNDPELDESLPRLGFIRAVEVDDEFRVRVTLRLPTYWCAANFAFMMAEDVRDSVERLSWVRGVSITVEDHFCGDEINRAVDARASFGAAFSGEADGDLGTLRRIFRAKAFMRRQEALLRRMVADGYTSGQLTSMGVDELKAISFRDDEGVRMRRDYLAIRHEFADTSKFAFVTTAGEQLTPANFATYLRELRRTTTNMEFNAAICGSLLKARYENG